MSTRRERLNTDYLNNINAGISTLIAIMIIANYKELKKESALDSINDKYSELMNSNLELTERSYQIDRSGE